MAWLLISFMRILHSPQHLLKVKLEAASSGMLLPDLQVGAQVPEDHLPVICSKTLGDLSCRTPKAEAVP